MSTAVSTIAAPAARPRGVARAGIVRNTAYLLIAGQAAKLMNFVQVLLLTRYLGTADFGIWTLGQSVPAMFFVLTDMGLGSILLRRICANAALQSAYAGRVLVLKIVLTVPFLLSVILFVHWSQYTGAVRAIILLTTVAYLALSYSDIMFAVNRAHENFAIESIVNAINSMLVFLSVCACMLLHYRLHGIAFGLLIVNALTSIGYFFWYLRTYGNFVLRWEGFAPYGRLLLDALPFALLALITPLFFQMDIVLLSRMSSYESVALYGAPYKIILFLFVLPDALRTVLFPRFTHLHVNDSRSYRSSFSDVLRITTLIAVPMGLGLFFCADKITHLLFARDFAASATCLKIMATYMILYFLRNVFGVALYAANRERTAISIFAGGTVLNGVLAFLLIPRFDFNGAAFASLVAEGSILVAYAWVVNRALFRVPLTVAYAKIALAGAALVAVCLLAAKFHVLMIIAIAGSAYCGAALALRILSSAEIGRIKRGLRRILLRPALEKPESMP
jgi:O-antigen/teichoic acid export membrane protein